MIRLRKNKDNDQIYWLIKHVLFPMTLRTNPDIVLRRSDMMKRLNLGKTFVETSQPGKVSGFIHLFHFKDPAWIDMLAVHPKRQKGGIGSKLMIKAEEEALNDGAKMLTLYVDANNIGGIRFYEKHGFHAVHYVSKLKCYQMMKRIA